MKKNKKTFISVIIITVVAVLFGYFLSRTSPKTLPKTSSVVSPVVSDSNNMDSMHNQPSVAVDNSGLNSLIGKSLPDIQLADKDGNVITNESLKGKNTVLFFNEGLMCYPACWNQIAGFGSDPQFNTDETQAISVVVDPSKDWQRAIDKMPELAKSKTLFDAGASVSGKLGLLTLPSSMHRGSLPGHTYILLDKEGIVRYVKDDPNMAMANDVLISKISQLN